MVQGALLFELGVGTHDGADFVTQYMTNGRGIASTNEIMEFTGKTSEQVSIDREPCFLKTMAFDLLGEFAWITVCTIHLWKHGCRGAGA